MITLVQEKPFSPILIRKREDSFEEDFDEVFDEDLDEDEEFLSPISISEDEEARFFAEDSLQDADSSVATADDGRVFLYDDESEVEQINLDNDE